MPPTQALPTVALCCVLAFAGWALASTGPNPIQQSMLVAPSTVTRTHPTTSPHRVTGSRLARRHTSTPYSTNAGPHPGFVPEPRPSRLSATSSTDSVGALGHSAAQGMLATGASVVAALLGLLAVCYRLHSAVSGGAAKGMGNLGAALLANPARAPEPVRMASVAAAQSAAPGAVPVAQRVALVTGANKGIGKAIAQRLADADPDLIVILGCRNERLGVAAAEELQGTNRNVVFHPLDIADPASVLQLQQFVVTNYGRLDILINNAAICFNDPTLYGKCEYTPFEKQADITVRTNFFGTLNVTQAMLPMLRASPSPRIIHVASAAGRLAILKSQDKVDLFTSQSLQVAEIEEAMREFVHDVESGTHAEKGWPNTCYGMSKLAIIALTKVLARIEPGIMVNSIDPGYCATDQNANRGTRSAEQGALTAVLLAQLPESEFVSGRYLFDGREVRW